MNHTLKLNKKIKLREFIKIPQKDEVIGAVALLLCQRASVIGTFPFGVAFFAASAKKNSLLLYFPAILIASLTQGASALKYLFCCFLLWIYKALKKDNKTALTDVSALFLSVVLSGLYEAVTLNSPVSGISFLTLEAIMSCICYPVFISVGELLKKTEKNIAPTRENTVCLVILLAILLMGLDAISLPFSISPKSIFSILLILCATMYSSFPVSVTFAFATGLISTLGQADTLTISAMFAAATLFSSMMKYFGPLGAAVGFLTGMTACVLITADALLLSISFIDIVSASILFAFIPQRFYQRTGIFLANTFRQSHERRDFRIKEYITEELNCFSHIFSEFAKRFHSALSKSPDSSGAMTGIFDETADRICIKCNRFSDCWQKNFNDTYKYMFQILDTTEKTGECTLQNAPVVFTQKCISCELFLNEFNHVYEMKKQALIQKGENKISTGLVSNQYTEISRIISELSEEIKDSFIFDEQMEKRIISLCSKEAVFIRDINVIKNKDGYYEVFFAPGIDSGSEKIEEIASEALGMKMKRVYCKNKALIKLAADNVYRINAAVFQKEKDSEPVSGDTVIHFETDKNKYYIILCDGMGSGYDASRESRMCAELLSGFLKAGFSKNVAINLINSTLALKMDREGFSTIDLCEIDLRTGKTVFVKIGGAQSYVRLDDNVVTVNAKTLPAGILENVDIENTEKILCENDMIVMVSDGVSETGYGTMRGEWVKRLMMCEGVSNEELAKSIVNSARKKIYPRTPDDMTAVVVTLERICEKEEEMSEDEAI